MRQGLASLPAAKRKKARRKNLRPRPQWVMLDPRLVRHRLRTSTASHHAPGAGLLARCEAKKAKEEKTQAQPTMGYAGPSTDQASTTDIDYCTSCARGWLPCPLRSAKRQGEKNSGPAHNVSCWTLDRSCIDYGHRLLHIMRQGQQRKKARRKKLRPLPQCIMLDPQLVRHRL